MTDLLLKIVGGLGLIIISIGVITDQKPKKDILFLIGGVDLLAYNIYIKDPVFIPLQIIFIIASSWEIYTSTNNN